MHRARASVAAPPALSWDHKRSFETLCRLLAVSNREDRSEATELTRHLLVQIRLQALLVGLGAVLALGGKGARRQRRPR